MGAENKIEVLVVGAGPAGLFAALSLAERGVRARVIDSYQRTALHSYAPALHPATLRMLGELGIADELTAIGHRVDRVAVHREGGSRDEIDLAAVKGAFPYVLVVPQKLLEGVMEKRLEQSGSRVEWRHQLMSLTQSDGGERVSATIGRMGDDPRDVALERVEAEFIIVADGYNSFARRALGIPIAQVGPLLHYGLLETTSHFEPRNCAQLLLGEARTDVFWPMPEQRGRWSIQLSPEREGDDESLSGRLRRRLRERAPWFPSESEPTEWMTLVDFQPRLARRFGLGRIWMIGDCARFTSPVGVQSMNVAMREAHDLVRRMTEILRRRGSPELLPIYNEERQREWKMLLGVDDRLKADGDGGWPHEWAARLVATLPATGVDLNRLLEQVGHRLHWTRHDR